MRLLALLAAGLFAGALVAAPVPKEKVKDEEAILGVWKAKGFDDGSGQVPPAEQMAKMGLTFDTGGKMVSRLALGREAEGTYKLDPAASPKALDLTEGKVTTPAVYELDGDTLKLCFGLGNTRPTEFKADAKRFVVVITLTRVKEEKKVKDGEAILGTWKVEKYEGGASPTAEEREKVRVTFTKDGKLKATGGPGGNELEMTYKLDPKADPKAIDTTVGERTELGIYALDGDSLTLCVNQEQGVARPKELKSDGRFVTLMILKRVKDEPKKDK